MDELNPGIRKIVKLLNDNDFVTCDSGDGETHDHECDRDHPYVVIHVQPEKMVDEARRLCVLLNEYGIDVLPLDEEMKHVSIQASFDPANNFAILDVVNIHDRLLSK